MKTKAILFDLDGTLLDTLDDIADSANVALRQLGFPEHPRDAYRFYIGDGIANLVRRALPEQRNDDATVAECVDRMKDEYLKRWSAKTRPYEGTAEMLSGVAARGLPMAVLSNKPHELTVLCVTRLLEKWDFAVVLGAGPAFPRKPDPAAALHVAEQLGVAPAEILYVGDTGTDMQTALAAGMYPVGVCWGFRPVEELRENHAAVILEKPTDLLAVLDDG